MLNVPQLQKLLMFAVIIPIALLLGLQLASPESFSSLLLISMILAVGCLPLLLKWHHPLLILSWNAALNAFFLPGQPDLWIVMVACSFFFSVWTRSLDRKTPLIFVPSISWPLIFLAVVIVVTAMAQGGIGLRSLGSANYGTRRYVTVLAAILGYFALSCQQIPRKHALLYGSLFFLVGITAAVSDLIYVAGPGFYFLYYLFPVNLAQAQASADFSMDQNSVFRVEGVAWACVSFVCFILLRYGAKGVLDLRRPWRLLVLILTVAVGLFGGFRSRLFLMAAFFIVQFCLEGLWRTRLLPIFLGAIVLVGIALAPIAEKLPPAVQRSLSFLPVQIDPAVQRDAEETVRWRVDLWRVLWPEVPKYFWLGKGYVFSSSDFYLINESISRGLAKSYDMAILTTEYHNGPLSVVVPFGIWGLMGFVWFVVAGWLALYRNYRYGDKDLQKVNTFFLTYYAVRVVFFFTIYGSLSEELCLLTGVLGLSIAINGGVKKNRHSRPVLEGPVLQPA